MPVLLAILGILGAAALWYWRFRMAKDAAGDLIDAARDVRAAARRFGFRRQTHVHPADAVEDPRLAAAGIALAVASIDGPHTRGELDALATECRARFGVGADEATDMVAFGRWVAGQCGTPEEAVRRLGRVVRKHAFDAGEDLLELTRAVASADHPEGAELGERETRAMNQLADIFGLR